MPKEKLCQQLADNLPPVPDGKKSIERGSTEIRGFHIRQNAGSRVGTYVYSYRAATGKRAHYNIGRTDVVPFEEARKIAIEKRLEVMAGRDPAYERLQKKQVMTLETFYENHFLPYVKPRLRSWDRYAVYWNCKVRNRFGATRIDRISLSDVQTFAAEIVEAGGKPATADRYTAFLRRMLSLATKWGHLQENPLRHLELFNPDNKIQDSFTDDEMQRLMRQLSIDSNREVACLITFLIATGARRGEGLRATHADIDLANRTWYIPATTAKSKVGRHVPLNALAIAVLEECQQRRAHHRSDYLFESKRTGSRFTDIKNQWHRILRDAGVRRRRVHDIRHGFATHLASTGTSLHVIAKLLGHAQSSTTERYAAVQQVALHRESDRLGRDMLQVLQASNGKAGSENDDEAA